MAEISAIIPSYNHAAYVLDAVKSVLGQTAPVREVIVVDDASQDDSLARLRSIRDPRLRIIAEPANRGGSEVLNIGIRAATSPLIAICNSDDIWEPEKLATQLGVLEESPEMAAVFSDVTLVGAHGHELADPGPYASIFRQDNRSRHGWIKHLVESKNCLCHPSVLIRREVYDKTGWYDNRLRQLPDYRMWLFMLRHFELHVLPDRLVRFRLHDNTSGPSPASSTRDRNEFADIIEAFFHQIDAETFYMAFGSRLAPIDSRFNLEVEKFLYLWSIGGANWRIFHYVATSLLTDLLDSTGGEKAWGDYGFTMRDFHDLRGIASPWIDLRAGSPLSDAENALLCRVAGGPLQAAQMVAQMSAPVQPGALPLRRAKIVREASRIGRQLAGIFSSRRLLAGHGRLTR
jgi:glycosyltransferase involved in cell wall biosynthesis